MRKLLVLMAVFAAAIALWVGVTLPPKHLTLSTPWSDRTIRGILHVHTNRSDGLSSPDVVAAAAARSGLAFVVFTDHGDATRKPDPPTYRSGVLCLDAVEISTSGGHYIAIDMPAAPYPLGGEARDVVEDVRRLGGFGVVAHPDSPKPQLQWREWTAPFDGIELVNPDTSWRVHRQQRGWRSKLRLLNAFVDYPFRSAEALTSLEQRPEATIVRWNALTERRRVVALAGADAHAKVSLLNADPGDNRFALPIPSYASTFRMLSVHVTADSPLSGDAASDGATLVRALRAGHAYSALDGLATPPAFEFSASNAHGTVYGGDELGEGGPVTLRVRTNAPPEFTTVVHEGSRVLSGGHHEAGVAVQAPAAPAVYWAEVIASTRTPPIAWIVSNPIYVRADQSPRLPGRIPASASTPMFDAQTSGGWQVEADPLSVAALDPPAAGGVAALRLRYGLGGGVPAGQYAALVLSTPAGIDGHDRLAFTVRAEHPMRISLQLRAGEGPVGERWQRSVYVDAFDQERVVYFDELTPIGATATWRPNPATIRAILFVVDTTNTRPGSSGRLWISKAALQR